MKKKLLIVLLLFFCVTCTIFILSACSNLFPQSKPSSDVKQYRVSVESTRGGEATKLYGNYKVGEQVNVSVITTYLGYDWCGWYIGDTLLTTSPNYTIVIPSADTVYTAKWEVKPEMQLFAFNATANSCAIVELKDKNLTEVIVPHYVTYVEKSAFHNCNELEKINVESGNTNYSSQDGVLYNNEKTELWHAPKSIKGEITMPDNVAEIFEGAFKDRDNLTSITISRQVRNIGNSAFSGCDNLIRVNWNATDCIFAGEWGDNCIFKNCTNLQSIIIGENVATIPSYAFFGCANITSIILPENISIIGKDAFYGCNGLTQISWNITNWLDVYQYTEGLFVNCVNLKTIIIGKNVTLIPDYIFSGCNNINSVIIGNKVTNIGYGAFQNCSGLTSITIPQSVTKIGDYSFNGCNLTSIIFEGTKAEWNAIEKESDWDMRTGDYIIHCIDGDISKE